MSERFELDLTTMAHGGMALGRHEGRAIFVPYALPGERVTAQITLEKERYAHAEVIELLSASPARVTPPCPHFGPGQCGGCHWQHISYAEQLIYKREVVIDQLKRIGKFEVPDVLPALASPAPYGYRSHMTFTVNGDGYLGFWSDDNTRIVPIDECHILHPALAEVFNLFDLGSPEIVRVRFQVGSDHVDRSIILEVAGDDAPEVEVDLPISVNLITRDNEPVNLIGSPQVTYQVRGRSFRVTAGGFFQVNLPVAEVLVEEVLSRLGLSGTETVLDLYSGVGLFTAFIAEQGSHVTSVESYPPAVTDSEINLSDLTNIDIIEGPVEAVIADLPGPFDAVVLDPPRTGLDPQVVDEIVRLAPPRLVYVSCDPATFARDAHRLAAGGYRLGSVQPVDMFPQTYHIESVAAFER